MYSCFLAGSGQDSARSIPPIRFRNVARAAGLNFVHENDPTPEKHMIETMPGGTAAFDYNGDGRTDIYFTNGASIPSLEKNSPKYLNRLFRNEGGMKFTDVTQETGVAGAGYSMAAAAADYDNDGNVDLFVAGVNRNILFRNPANGKLEDVTAKAGIKNVGWAVAGGWFDFDNDGWKDLFTANSRVNDRIEHFEATEYKQPNSVFANIGGGVFREVSREAGVGLETARAHRGAAFADFNNDGKIDAVVSSLKDEAELWENISPAENHWLILRFIGTKSNREGIGARVRIGDQVNHMTTSFSYASSSDFGIHFGLGKAEKIEKIEITWPSGTTQVLKDIEVNRVIQVKEP